MPPHVFPQSNNPKIAIIGLGYVGLPLAIEFAKQYDVIGFDIDSNRVKSLQNLTDETGECNSDP
jgi:UDP-N-acetyl-D-galactosamine dehydrogenase